MRSRIKEVAKKYNITMSEAERIFYFQFKFTADVIQNDRTLDERRSIQLPRFGTFYFSKAAKNKIERNVKNKLSTVSPEDGNGDNITEHSKQDPRNSDT